MPTSVVEGGTMVVRVDGAPSGNVVPLGTNHLRDIVVELALPAGVTLLPRSARIVAGTGSDNVRPG